MNSRTLLSGNEPGLIAYYPSTKPAAPGPVMPAGAAMPRRRRTPTGAFVRHPSAAAKHELRRFVGGGDYVPLSPKLLPRGNALTVSFWAGGGAGLPVQSSLLSATNAVGSASLTSTCRGATRASTSTVAATTAGYDRLSQAASPKPITRATGCTGPSPKTSAAGR